MCDGLEVHKRWRAEVDAIGLGAAIADDIGCELTAGRLDGGHCVAAGRLKPFGPELKVVDERLHAMGDLALWRRGDLAVGRHIAARAHLAQPRKRLVADPNALAE